jgi:hypothetical protein
MQETELTAEALAQVLQEPKVALLRQVLQVLGPARTTAVQETRHPARPLRREPRRTEEERHHASGQ